MDGLTRDDLARLMGERGGPCVSILMPTHRAGADRKQDPIRFRNLIKAAEQHLREEGVRGTDAEAMLAPASDLAVDDYFWDYLADGLAMYLTAESNDIFRVPVDLEELVVVGERFTLTPLIPAMDPGAHFFVLALSENSFRFFEGGRFGMTQMGVPGAPASIGEAFEFSVFEKGGSRGGAKNLPPGTRKGHAVGGKELEDMKEPLAYFRKIDHALRRRLRSESAPLVLAGVEYLMDAYRSITAYKHVADEIISGNPEHTPVPDLHGKAWTIVEPLLAETRNRDVARLEEGLGKGRGATDLKEILPAAVQGRVETLFVAEGARVGTAETDGAIKTQSDAPGAGDIDLLDAAALHVFTKDGTVYVVAPEQVPTGTTIAAELRY